MKILIAEDDKFLANAYRVKLKKAGFDIKLASDGVEALAALDSFKPDLVLLDLVMPKKDGFAVLSEIRNNSEHANLPVIVATNLGQKEDTEKAKKLGATDYIVKSDLSMKDIIEKIKSHIPSS